MPHLHLTKVVPVPWTWAPRVIAAPPPVVVVVVGVVRAVAADARGALGHEENVLVLKREQRCFMKQGDS